MLNGNIFTWNVHFLVHVSEVVDIPANFVDCLHSLEQCCLGDGSISTRDWSGLLTLPFRSWYVPAYISLWFSNNHSFVEVGWCLSWSTGTNVFMSSAVGAIHFGALAGGGIRRPLVSLRSLVHSTLSQKQLKKKSGKKNLVHQAKSLQLHQTSLRFADTLPCSFVENLRHLWPTCFETWLIPHCCCYQNRKYCPQCHSVCQKLSYLLLPSTHFHHQANNFFLPLHCYFHHSQLCPQAAPFSIWEWRTRKCTQTWVQNYFVIGKPLQSLLYHFTSRWHFTQNGRALSESVVRRQHEPVMYYYAWRSFPKALGVNAHMRFPKLTGHYACAHFPNVLG